ncbi:MAG: aminopeptidase P N-terminal domain-containing protein [Bacteroidales bacterium]|nr:aminopeptidase P N-terminal domain-containing protein [Bacteroidales bacterium]
MLSKETYIKRRSELLQLMKGEKGVALFIGNVASAAQYQECAYKWRQDSTWLYLFGIDEPRLAATIDLETGETVLFGDDCDIDDIIWNGPTPSIADHAASAGIEKTAPYGALAAALKGRPVHFVPVSRWYNAVMLSNLLGIKPEECFRAGKAGCPKASLPLVRALVKLRLVKDAEEIALIDQACVLGQEMHTVARKGIRIGQIEQQIVGDMEAVALAKGWGVSFETILTQHGEVFHCHSHAQAIEPGRLLVVDAGLESNEHYASDFTRTYPTGGKFTPKQRDVYQIVYECNQLAFELTRPGVAYRDVHIKAMEHMLARLQDLGLVHGDPSELAAAGFAGLFCPHGLGHNMGLDVHDMEDYGEDLVGYDPDQKRSDQLGLGSLRMARRLVAGNVVTDEPGIYFIPALIAKWKSEGIGLGVIDYSKLEAGYLDFGGIRLEDDVLVTADGARRLGGPRLPASPGEIEEAMAAD